MPTTVQCGATSQTARIGPLITRPLDVKLIEENWDDFLRVAASLKMGWVTASTPIGKLLADAGYEVYACASYGEALGLLRREKYALAVVDLSLDGSGGQCGYRW